MLRKMIGLLCCFPLAAQAIYIDAMTFDMPSDKDFIAKNVFNDNKESRLYTISAVAIDQPGENEKRSTIRDGEVLFTPLRFILDGEKTEFFKIFYRGPKDDKERYYRIAFTESMLELDDKESAKRQVMANEAVSLETILVVRPRKQNFTYQYDPAQGRLTNTGNTYFKVIIKKGCDGTEEDSYQAYVLPGTSVTRSDLKGNNQKFIQVFDKYVKLGKQCFN